MILPPGEVTTIAGQFVQMREQEQVRLRRIGKYVDGRHDAPYVPKGVNAEYRWISKRSKRNFLPLIVSVISQNLHVDGYRPSGETTEEQLAGKPNAMWSAFTANRMISRQHGVHRAVIKYGTAYVIVLPGVMATGEEHESNSVPVIRPVSPRRLTAFYADGVDDEWPLFAIEEKVVLDSNAPGKQVRIVSVYDENNRYILTGPVGTSTVDLDIADDGDPILNGQPSVAEHGLGICPVVRFVHEADLDGDSDCVGEVEPLMPIQDQINFSTFNMMITEQFAAFRQRWVTGMMPVDEEGGEAKPFRPGVDRVWVGEDPATRFGEFGESSLTSYNDSREAGIRHMSTISQVPPYHLLGQIANLSAEALAAARDGLDRKVGELQSILTDSWRNTYRLTAKASGDQGNWNDLNGSVIWRDTSARAFSATIDGLTKVAQMLGVPVEELWKRIPGVTSDDVQAWLLAKQRADAEAQVQQAIGQAGAAQAAIPSGAEQQAQALLASPPPGGATGGASGSGASPLTGATPTAARAASPRGGPA